MDRSTQLREFDVRRATERLLRGSRSVLVLDDGPSTNSATLTDLGRTRAAATLRAVSCKLPEFRAPSLASPLWPHSPSSIYRHNKLCAHLL